MDNLRSSIKAGDSQKVEDNLKRLLERGEDAKDLLDNMIESLREVGDAFSKGEAFIPEMLIAAKAVQHGADFLNPELIKKKVPKIGKFMIATVEGDMHDVGKNLVAMMFRGNGFETIDLGVDVSPNMLIEAFDEYTPDIVGLSALLTTTMGAMKASIEALKTKFPHSKIIIGGAPITQEFADEIGADGYAPDANEAVNSARKLMGNKSNSLYPEVES